MYLIEVELPSHTDFLPVPWRFNFEHILRGADLAVPTLASSDLVVLQPVPRIRPWESPQRYGDVEAMVGM